MSAGKSAWTTKVHVRDVRHGRGSRGSMIGEGQGVRLTPEGLEGSSGVFGRMRDSHICARARLVLIALSI